jgi:hypothetical protein
MMARALDVFLCSSVDCAQVNVQLKDANPGHGILEK